MFKMLTIKVKLIFRIIIGVLIVFLVGGFCLESYSREWIYNENYVINQRIINI